MIKKATFLLMMCSFSLTGYAESANSNVCLYEGQPYAPGSLLCMAGIVRECRDNSHESQRVNMNAYVLGRETEVKLVLQWRKPIDDLSGPNRSCAKSS